MALYRCGGGGGGKLDETVLWTNPNVTVEFSSQAVTLSDSVDNYDYIKFVFNLSTTSTTQRCSIYSVGELKTLVNPTNNWSRASSPMRSNSNNTSYVRGIIYNSNTSVNIGAATAYASSGTSNSALIPYQIIGMKFGNKRPVTPSGTRTLLWENSDPTVTFATQTITLPQSVNNFAYIEVIWYGDTSMISQATMIIPVNQLNGDTQYKGWARYALGMNNSTSGSAYARPVAFPSDTQIRFGNNSDWAGGSGSLNTGAIPYRVNGIS